MQTEMLPDTSGVPYLEYVPAGKSSAEKVFIDDSPFTIGRADTCNFPVNSTKVSREHVAIKAAGRGYLVTDLGSTNGTQLNGEPIDSMTLNDGDVLVVADVELTYFSGQHDTVSSASVTQVMDGPADGKLPQSSPRLSGCSAKPMDTVLALRRLQHSVTHRAVGLQQDVVARLPGNTPWAFEIVRQLNPFPWLVLPRKLSNVECRLTERLNSLYRLLAAEQASRTEKTPLFLSLEAVEIGAANLPESLDRLRQIAQRQLVVQIPDSAVCDIPYFRTFLARLAELEILTAYDGFAGGPVQISEQRNIAPDFIKLAPTLTRGIDRSSGGQRQLQAVIGACEELGCRVIATEVGTQDIVDILVELGCEYAQGEYFRSSIRKNWPNTSSSPLPMVVTS